MKYKVIIQKIYDTEIEVEAESEEEAEELANAEFNNLVIYGSEMYENNIEIKELEDSIE